MALTLSDSPPKLLKNGLDPVEMGRRGARKREENRAARAAAAEAAAERGVGETDLIGLLVSLAEDGTSESARVAAIRTALEQARVATVTMPTSIAQVQAMTDEELRAYAARRELALH